MPLRWEISHADKLVVIVGEGVVTLKDVEVYLDAIVTAEAMPYGKLFDAAKVIPEHDDNDLMMLGARMSAYSSTLKGGPLAFVVTDPATRQTIERYINLSKADRPVAIFGTAIEARAWIDAQPKD
jgi:thiamine pyrophosphate-dependent acetolactate synthase large subunit-like protein